MMQGPSVGWSAGSGRPTVIQPSAYRSTGSSGIDCMCCTCCPCINLGFIRTKAGWLKVMELVLSAICLFLVLDYGMPYATSIGESFHFFLVTNSACIFMVSLLTFCYIILGVPQPHQVFRAGDRLQHLGLHLVPAVLLPPVLGGPDLALASI
nr:protein singles bar-like [Penaeus vannamei]